MDDNTTKVVLTVIALAFVLAVIRQFDRVSLHIERLRIDILARAAMSEGPRREKWAARRSSSAERSPRNTRSLLQGMVRGKLTALIGATSFRLGLERSFYTQIRGPSRSGRRRMRDREQIMIRLAIAGLVAALSWGSFVPVAS